MEFNVKNKKELIVNGHSISIFSSFYVNPQSVLDKALKISPFIHKEDPLTLNTLKFLDLRYKTNMPELDPFTVTVNSIYFMKYFKIFRP